MHGSAATDIALLCKGSGVDFYMPEPNSQIVRTLTKIEERPYFEKLGAKFLSDVSILEMLKSRALNSVLLSTPEQIEQYQLISEGHDVMVPFIIRHGLNSFDKFKKLGTKNFITSSKDAALKMAECNCFITRKLIPWDMFPRPSHTERRKGFFSYIHGYSKKFPKEYDMFGTLQGLLPTICIKNYGNGSPDGEVNDLKSMSISRGTIHIKGGNAVCNAVVRSMAVGTPVIMDSNTYKACHFDQINGIIVKDNIEGVVHEIEALMNEDILDEKSFYTYMQAKKQFSFVPELKTAFLSFLNSLSC